MVCHTLSELLIPLATHPSPVLLQDELTVSGAELLAQVQRLAGVLRDEYKVQSGDRVGLLFWNETEFFVGLFACRWIGAVAVPFNIMMSAQDLLYVVQHSETRLMLANADLLLQVASQARIPLDHIPFPVVVSGNPPEAAELPQWSTLLAQATPVLDPVVEPEALALLMYTSGTTGLPKGVMLSEQNLLSNMSGFAQQLQLDDTADQHRMLVGLPLFHSYGLMCALYGLAMKATLILIPRFQPKKMIAALVESAVTILPLVPTMFHVVAQQADKVPAEAFSNLVCCISGGAALSPDLLKRVEALLGAPVLEGYGMTETSPVIAVNSPARGSVAGTVGRPLDNLSVRLVDEQGQTIERSPQELSGVGEIQVQGPNVMMGYYRLPEETRQVYTEDGWLKTGDLGQFDAEGHLRIVGRIKELIIKAGENIAPLPIELVITQVPGVGEVAVVGQPDSRLGEKIVAFYTAMANGDDAGSLSSEEATALKREIQQACRAQLPPLQQPDELRFLPSLPKTPTGKVMKKVLRQQLVQEQALAQPC